MPNPVSNPMSNRMLRSAFAIMLCNIVLLAQPPDTKKGPQPQAILQVKPGFYYVTGAGANAGVRVTSEGIILVDTKLPGDANYNGLMEQIKTVSGQPVKFAVVTHHHADHTGNVGKVLESGTQVVAQENLNANLASYQFTPKPAPANITYKTDYTIRLGGAEARVLHFGRAHTSGDSVVFFPDLKIVMLSDAVTTTTGPLIDYAGGGSALEWPHVLDEILQLDFDSAIPGNGPVLSKADVRAYKAKLETTINRAKELVHQGVPKDRLLAQIKSDDIGWTLRLPPNGGIDAFYQELGGVK